MRRRVLYARRIATLFAGAIFSCGVGCAALSGLSSLEEVQCVDNCDGSSPKSDGSAGGDGSSQGDAANGLDGAGKDGAQSSDATADVIEEFNPAIQCAGGTCEGASTVCCFDVNMPLSTNCNLGSCPINNNLYQIECAESANCDAGSICCLGAASHISACTTTKTCTVAGEQLCGSSFDCATGFSCGASPLLTGYKSCQ